MKFYDRKQLSAHAKFMFVLNHDGILLLTELLYFKD